MPKHLDVGPKGYVFARNPRLTRIKVHSRDSWASAYFRLQSRDANVLLDKRRRVWVEHPDLASFDAQAGSNQNRIGSRVFQLSVALVVLLSLGAGSLAWSIAPASSSRSAKAQTSVAMIRQSKSLQNVQKSKTPPAAANYCPIAPSSIRFEEIKAPNWHSLGGLQFATSRLGCARGQPEVTVIANFSQRSILSVVQRQAPRG